MTTQKDNGSAGNAAPQKSIPPTALFAGLLVLVLSAAMIFSGGAGKKETDNGQEQTTLSAGDDAEKTRSRKIASADDVKIEAVNPDGAVASIYAIKNGDTEIGRIEQVGEHPYFEVVEVQRNKESLFLMTRPVGLGGYYVVENMMGDDLYRVDLQDGYLEKLFSVKDGYEKIQAVSSDGVLLATTADTENGKATVRVLSLPGGNEVAAFGVPEKYKQVGHVAFSSDDKVIVFEAAVGDPDAEEIVAFGADISTKEQKQFAAYAEAMAWGNGEGN